MDNQIERPMTLRECSELLGLSLNVLKNDVRAKRLHAQPKRGQTRPLWVRPEELARYLREEF